MWHPEISEKQPYYLPCEKVLHRWISRWYRISPWRYRNRPEDRTGRLISKAFPAQCIMLGNILDIFV